MKTVQVGGNQGAGFPGTRLVEAGDGVTLIYNASLTTPLIIGDRASLQATDQDVAPIQPNGSLVVRGDSDVYGTTAGNVQISVYIFDGGIAYFRGITQSLGSLSIPSIFSPNYVPGVSGWAINQNGTAQFNSIVIPPGSGGATIFTQSTTPTAHNVNDLWIDTGNANSIYTWNGSAWVQYQFGTGAISAGAITAALIAANTITAAQIAANTITAGQIAANTITAAQLAAGIIYAGIVDGTTISGSTVQGGDCVLDTNGSRIYSVAAPGAKNKLTSSASSAAYTDSFGNDVVGPGIAAYNTTNFTACLLASDINGSTVNWSGLAWYTSATDETSGWTLQARLFYEASTGWVFDDPTNSLNLQSAPSGTLSILSDASGTIPKIQLFRNVGGSNSCTLFTSSPGGLQTQPFFDSNNYNVGHTEASSAGSQTISSTTATAITGSTVNVGAQAYKLLYRFYIAASQAAGTAVFSWAGTATISFAKFTAKAYGSWGTLFAVNNALSNFSSPAFTDTTHTNMVEVEIEFTASAAGTIVINGQEGTSGDSWIVQNVFSRLEKRQ